MHDKNIENQEKVFVTKKKTPTRKKLITTFKQKKQILLVNVHSNASVSSRLSTNNHKQPHIHTKVRATTNPGCDMLLLNLDTPERRVHIFTYLLVIYG